MHMTSAFALIVMKLVATELTVTVDLIQPVMIWLPLSQPPSLQECVTLERWQHCKIAAAYSVEILTKP
jgi:hypothetical protein